MLVEVNNDKVGEIIESNEDHTAVPALQIRNFLRYRNAVIRMSKFNNYINQLFLNHSFYIIFQMLKHNYVIKTFKRILRISSNIQ